MVCVSTRPYRWHRKSLRCVDEADRDDSALSNGRARSRSGTALHVTRHLYNAALQERKDAYRLRHVSVTAKMQYAELTALRKASHHLAGVYRELEDAVLRRLDLAFAACFRRNKRGEKPGLPSRRRRYKSGNARDCRHAARRASLVRQPAAARNAIARPIRIPRKRSVVSPGTRPLSSDTKGMARTVIANAT